MTPSAKIGVVEHEKRAAPGLNPAWSPRLVSWKGRNAIATHQVHFCSPGWKSQLSSTKVAREIRFRSFGWQIATFEHESSTRSTISEGFGWQIATLNYESIAQSVLSLFRIGSWNHVERVAVLWPAFSASCSALCKLRCASAPRKCAAQASEQVSVSTCAGRAHSPSNMLSGHLWFLFQSAIS